MGTPEVRRLVKNTKGLRAVVHFTGEASLRGASRKTEYDFLSKINLAKNQGEIFSEMSERHL